MTNKRAAYLVVVLAMATVAWTYGGDKAAKKPVLRHVVLFQYKEGTASGKVKEISKASIFKVFYKNRRGSTYIHVVLK